MSDIEKQDLSLSNDPVPQNPVLPRLHPSKDVLRAVQGSDLRADAILQSLAFHCLLMRSQLSQFHQMYQH